jgi:hypothetical protein
MTIEEWRRLRERSDMRELVTRAAMVKAPVTTIRDGAAVTIYILYAPALPIELARKAGVKDIDVYSLARLLASEGFSGADYTLAMMLMGTVTRRVAKARYPKSATPITTLLTYSIFPVARGHYGEQSGRWAATTQDPTRWHVLMADAILHDEIPDMTRGAVKFVDPWPPGAVQQGKPLRPFDKVMRSWHGINNRLAWVRSIPGIEDHALALFAPERDPAKRANALNDVLAIWRTRFGKRETLTEGH